MTFQPLRKIVLQDKEYILHIFQNCESIFGGRNITHFFPWNLLTDGQILSESEPQFNCTAVVFWLAAAFLPLLLRKSLTELLCHSFGSLRTRILAFLFSSGLGVNHRKLKLPKRDFPYQPIESRHAIVVAQKPLSTRM